MKLAIFGATGGTGRQLVQQALDEGHHVTAVVRDPTRLPVIHPALEVITADVTDPNAMKQVLHGRDAALSALGPRSNREAGIVSLATGAILSALEATGVRRFVTVSAAPVGEIPEGESMLLRYVVTPLVRRTFRSIYADLARMEEIVRASRGIEWTIVRPPRLLNRPPTGRYRRVVGANVPRGSSVSRADLAHAMLALLDDPVTVRQVVGIAY